MKYRLRVLPAAAADVESAFGFIASDSLSGALKFYDAVDRTFRQITEHPARWPRYELGRFGLAGIRKCAVAGFRNFLIFYRIANDAVEIVRVLHGARDIPSILADEM
jgi:toxin ParE1/3/4